jgi:hypothetical protein
MWAATAADAQPSIDHSGIECVAPGKFAVILSGIDPELEVQTAKVYFRSSLYPDFYYVEMTYENGRFQGILPSPSPETTRIVYYLEAIDGVFNGTRSIEWDPPVDECDDDPGVAYFIGDPAGIVVGATTAGQSALPAGFSAVGIVGTIAATGAATGIGGGIGAGTAVAVGAAAAGAAGAVVAASGAAGEATTTAVAAGPTSTPSIPGPDPMPATTSVAPPDNPTTIVTTTTTPANTTTSSGGAATTTVGTTTTAATTTIVTTSVATTSVATTSVATTTILVPPLNAGCFTVQVLGECRVRVDATCVNLPVDRYEWVLDVGGEWQQINLSSGPASLVQDWSSDCDDDNESIQFRLTVHRGADSDTSLKSVNVPGEDDLTAPPGAGSQRLGFDSHLAVSPFDGTVQARITLNESFTRFIDNSGTVRVTSRAPAGTNTLRGTLTRGGEQSGLWRFDFGSDARLERGSLRAVRGNVQRQDEHSIVFLVAGLPGEIVELTFVLRR